jgi:cysteine desulfurase
VQWANNETGVLQPVGEIGRLCRDRGVTFHTDATQAVGKIPVDMTTVSADLLTLSAHKFHGPKGVGALVVRKGARLAPVAPGAQEMGRRGGTENVPGIAGLGAAAVEARAWLADEAARSRLAALRDRLESSLVARFAGARVNGLHTDRLWNTSSVTFPGLNAEQALMILSERGVYASAGAACASGASEASHVLSAMGLDEESARGTIRFSLSRDTTPGEIDRAADAIAAALDAASSKRATLDA